MKTKELQIIYQMICGKNGLISDLIDYRWSNEKWAVLKKHLDNYIHDYQDAEAVPKALFVPLYELHIAIRRQGIAEAAEADAYIYDVFTGWEDAAWFEAASGFDPKEDTTTLQVPSGNFDIDMSELKDFAEKWGYTIGPDGIANKAE